MILNFLWIVTLIIHNQWICRVKRQKEFNFYLNLIFNYNIRKNMYTETKNVKNIIHYHHCLPYSELTTTWVNEPKPNKGEIISVQKQSMSIESMKPPCYYRQEVLDQKKVLCQSIYPTHFIQWHMIVITLQLLVSWKLSLLFVMKFVTKTQDWKQTLAFRNVL